MEKLRTHNVTLSDGRLVLRPMTEDDWDLLMRWNTDADVLYYADGDDVTSRTLEEVQEIFRGVSRKAFVFVAELDGVPVGECWLQEMNLPRIVARHPGKDLRRIDLTIGEKHLWGQGWGTRTIGLLTRFGFDREGADALFGCDVADYNVRSRRAFERNGYVVDAEVTQPPGRKSKVNRDMILTRDAYGKVRKGVRNLFNRARNAPTAKWGQYT